jgi:hypothetical protein
MDVSFDSALRIEPGRAHPVSRPGLPVDASVVYRLQARRHSFAPYLDGVGVVRQGCKEERTGPREHERQEPGPLF